jgi:hypothetical protein
MNLYLRYWIGAIERKKSSEQESLFGVRRRRNKRRNGKEGITGYGTFKGKGNRLFAQRVLGTEPF